MQWLLVIYDLSQTSSDPLFLDIYNYAVYYGMIPIQEDLQTPP